MPALTHIKFDMNVQRTSPSHHLCHGSDMEIQQNYSEFDLMQLENESWDESEESLTIPAGSPSSWFDMKLFRVANTLSEVLNNSQPLRVCILVLRFDADPAYTAKSITTSLASQKLLDGDRRVLVNAETDVLLAAANWFDPRLVFAHEREPFRYSHAHSKHEMNLWKSAEAMVNSQRYTTSMFFFFFLLHYVLSDHYQLHFLKIFFI